MHILAAARALPFHSIGGMQSIAWDLLTEFVELGHRVTVMTTHLAHRAEPFVEQGVHVVPIAAPAERYSRAWWDGSRAYAVAHAHVGFDAVFSVSVAGAGLASLKGSALPVPFVCQLHGSSWAEAVTKWKSGRPTEWLKSVKNLMWLPKDAAIYRRFDALILVGDVLERDFARIPTRWLVGRTATTVIRNGIDTRHFKFDAGARLSGRAALGWAETDRVAVFAARLHSQKGGAEAIRALAVLRATDERWKLLIIGGGPEEASLKALSNQLGCDKALNFTGALPRERLAALLSVGDVFVFPSLRQEGLPMNVLEALATGLPCVCADTLSAVFGPGLAIAYAPPRDSVNFAAAIAKSHPGAPPAASRLPPGYSLRECAAAYLALFARLDGSRSQPE